MPGPDCVGMYLLWHGTCYGIVFIDYHSPSISKSRFTMSTIYILVSGQICLLINISVKILRNSLNFFFGWKLVLNSTKMGLEMWFRAWVCSW